MHTCCFIVTNQNLSFRQAKKNIIFIFCIIKFKHMFVHSAQTHGGMLELKNRRKNIPAAVFFAFSSKNRQNSSCKIGFDIPPLQALNQLPLAWKVDLLPTRAEVYDISWVLHCFDVALPNQHFTYWWFFKS